VRKLTVAIIGLFIWSMTGLAFADNVTIEVIQAPAANSVLRGDDPFLITMKASADSTLKSFYLYITPDEPGRQGMKVNGGWAGGSWSAGTTASSTLSLHWNTKTVTPYNGLYKVVGTAESHLSGTKAIQLAGYAVDNPPSVVSGLDSGIKSGAPYMSWNANNEVDLIGYHIYRAVGSAEYENIGVTTTTAYADKEAPKGVQIKYYVVAVRRSVVATDGWIESAPSKATSFFIPLPQSNAQATVSAPQEAPAPPPIPNVEARPPGKVVHRGFEELLPYESLGDYQPEAPAPLSVEEGPAILLPGLQSPPPISLPQVYKPPFFAGALLMIAAAAHIGRLAISVFVGGEKKPTDGRPIEPASSL